MDAVVVGAENPHFAHMPLIDSISFRQR
jgi:hypothetical protein